MALPSVAHAGSITLAWDANPASESVQGYRVYVGTSAGTYTVPGSPFNVVGGSVNQYVFAGATPGVTYFFALSAYNAGGESPLSPGISGFTTGPAVTITSPTSGNTFSTATTAFTFAGTATDDAAVTLVTWNNDRGGSGTATLGGTQTSRTWTANLTLASGVNVLTVTAADAASNQATDTLTVTLDATTPMVTITTPTAATTFATTTAAVTLGGTASDAMGVTQVTWSNANGGATGSATLGGTATAATWSASLTLTSGVNVVTVTARDGANNTATDTVTVTLDLTAPVVTITTPTAATTYSTATAVITLGGTATDAIGVTQVTWSNANGGASGSATLGGTATAATWSATLTLPSGNNVLTVTAGDAANNAASDTLTVTNTSVPDTMAPVVAITTPTAAATFATGTAAITLGGTASDAVGVTQVTWSNDRGGSGTAALGGTATAATWTASLTLASAVNVVTVTTRDAANNTATDTLTVTNTAQAPSGVVLDTLTGTNGTLLTAHAADVAPGGAAWTVLGGAPSPVLQSGAVRASGSGFVIATINSGLSNGIVATDFRSQGTPEVQFAGVVFRAVDTNQLLLLRYASTPTSGILQLFQRVAGDFLIVTGTTTLPPGVPGALHRLEARFVGNAIEAVLDNVVIFTATVNLYQTATQHGLLWHVPSDATATFDNFAVTAAGPDVTVPVVTIATPTAAATHATGTAAVTVGGSASDAVGVTQVTWSNSNGGATGTATGTTSWSAPMTLQVGANVLTVTARDAANNSATDTLTVTYTVPVADTTAPVVTITTPTTAATHATGTAAVTLGGTASDAVGVTQVTWSNSNGGATGTATGTTSWSAPLTLQSGVNVLTVTARDAANNTATDTLTVTYTASAPSGVLDTFTGSDAALLTAHAADVAPGGAAWTVLGGAPSPVLQSGAVQASGSGFVIATINSGLSNGIVATDFRSQGTPEVQFAGVVFRAVDTNQLLLLRYASTPTSGILQLFQRVAGDFLIVTGTTTLPPGVPGALHRLEARFAGNAIEAVLDNVVIFTATVNLYQTATQHGLLWHVPSDATATFDNFAVTAAGPDVTVPVVTIATPTAAATHATGTAAVTLGGTASDAVGVTQVTWSNSNGGATGTATGTTSWSAPLTLQSGVNVLTVTARDAANNTATDTLTVTYTASAPSTVLDTFTGIDATPLAGHAADVAPGGAAWTVLGGAPSPVLQSGTLRAAGGSGFVVATIDSGLSNGAVATDFRSQGTPEMQYAGLVFRAVDVNNLMLLRYASTTTTGILQLFMRVGGNFMLVGGTMALPAGAAGALHRLEVRFVGSAITAVLDDAVIFTTSVNLFPTATRHGVLWHVPSDATAAFDNFTVTP